MRYLALACDYDGTLAADGRVTEATSEAVRRLRASGRKFILVTGRQLGDLLTVFENIDLCDWIVAENGALLYCPATREEKCLADPPPVELIGELQRRHVPLAVGRAIIATWQPHETTVLEAIRDLGLERQVIFNKGAVMVLPSGVNKATGLVAALGALELSSHNAVGIGDAENDHAFLRLCECSVAVQNALPMVKDAADLVTAGDHGAGVVELVDRLLEGELADVEPRLTRHHILVGTQEGGQEIRIPPYGVNILLAGTSGSGKSTLATGLLERMAEKSYQFCVIDPEGDYEYFDGAVVLGDSQRGPTVEQALQLLKKPRENAVVNLVGLPLADRPKFFSALLPRLQELRLKTGRPHWLVIDEAHHLLPSGREPAASAPPPQLAPVMLITVHPNQVMDAILSTVDVVIAVGNGPGATLREAAGPLGQKTDTLSSLPDALQPGEAVFWPKRNSSDPLPVRIAPCRMERVRHRRKYAEGDLGPDRSFYFQGPEGKLNLRAQNLFFFIQLAEGVDDDTWTYHLRRGDFSKWFREAIKNDRLSDQASQIEEQTELSPAESRTLIKEAISEHYTLPASSPG
jgi:hydroxymethylpyrimidine pyrophosphatase-like HAD family hydrolase